MFKYWGCPRYVIKHTIFFYFVSFPSPLLRFYSHFTSAIRECEQPDLPGDETQTGVIGIIPSTVGTEAVVQLMC